MGKVVEFEAINQAEIRSDLPSMFRGAVIVTLETILEDVVKVLVGAKRYERMDTRKGYRNGSYMRGLLTSMGQVNVRGRTARPNGRAARRSRAKGDQSNLFRRQVAKFPARVMARPSTLSVITSGGQKTSMR